MSGYAVSGRIERVVVHPIAGERPAQAPTRPAAPVDSTQPAAQLEESSPGGLDALLEDLRARWAQTTFYLFDADGWR
jgi:hypothetical protein